MNIKCDYCGKEAKKTTGAEIYPHRDDLHALKFYACMPCAAWVGCHKKTGKPLGRLANADLRKAKMNAHKAFDPLWKNGDMTRGDAYAWLSNELCISRDKCHIGMFDIDQCWSVVDACNNLLGSVDRPRWLK